MLLRWPFVCEVMQRTFGGVVVDAAAEGSTDPWYGLLCGLLAAGAVCLQQV